MEGSPSLHRITNVSPTPSAPIDHKDNSKEEHASLSPIASNSAMKRCIETLKRYTKQCWLVIVSLLSFWQSSKNSQTQVALSKPTNHSSTTGATTHTPEGFNIKSNKASSIQGFAALDKQEVSINQPEGFTKTQSYDQSSTSTAPKEGNSELNIDSIKQEHKIEKSANQSVTTIKDINLLSNDATPHVITPVSTVTQNAHAHDILDEGKHIDPVQSNFCTLNRKIDEKADKIEKGIKNLGQGVNELKQGIKDLNEGIDHFFQRQEALAKETNDKLDRLIQLATERRMRQHNITCAASYRLHVKPAASQPMAAATA